MHHDDHRPEPTISQQRKSYLMGHSALLSFNSFLSEHHISLSVILLGVHARLWLLGHLCIMAIHLFLSSPLEHPEHSRLCQKSVLTDVSGCQGNRMITDACKYLSSANLFCCETQKRSGAVKSTVSKSHSTDPCAREILWAHGLCSCPLIWGTNDQCQHQLLLGSLPKLLFFWLLQLNDFTRVLVFWFLHLFSVKDSLKINVISSPQAVAEFRRFVDHYL